MLTYNEFKEITLFTDKTSSEKFKKFYRESKETYLSELIGEELVDKANDYPDILPLIKKCLAFNIELMLVEIGNISVSGEGANTRTGDYYKQPEFVDKQNKIKAVKKVLRANEVKLLNACKDLPEFNKNKKITSKYYFTINSAGKC